MANNKPYDRNDNDTYVDIYSMIPERDVEIHMFQDPKGRTNIGDGMHGNFSVESTLKASHNVLHFPTATECGLVKITDRQLHTLMPMSLVERYKLSEERLAYAQKTPIFYDIKLNKFVVLLDKRFLRDVNISELNLGINNRDYKTYNNKKNTCEVYFGILFSSVDDIIEKCTVNVKDENQPFYNLFKAYQFYKMTLQDGEKVIVVQFKTQENEKSSLFGYNVNKYIDTAITARSFNIEHAVAVRFGSRYYFCDHDGKILQESAFHLDKALSQSTVNETSAHQLTLANLNKLAMDKKEVFVTAYSEEQLAVIEGLSKRMYEIQQELCNLFKTATKSDESLDASILSLPQQDTLYKRLSKD